ncbi:glyoxalase 3 [Nematostella vectensis]|uniref:glyoxalase 3 n=1 Tax=Nematostella vectensis TaxID=45351 RepID=UPI00207776DB|nr:glyoxalase 3 [Nematostella vectensis]
MVVRVIIVLTNHKDGGPGWKTGWYLPEAAHPYHVFKQNGYQVTFASPLGGDAPMDPGSYQDWKDKDDACREFCKMCKINGDDINLPNTVALECLRPEMYDIMVCAGGHGPMWDFPDFQGAGKPERKSVVNKYMAAIYEKGGIVSAVCHGPAGIVDTKLSNGEYLVKGKEVTCFTNDEEDAIDKSKLMPFMLETRLIEHGAKFKRAKNWECMVCVDNRVVTGQNPASASPMGEAIVKLQKAKE